MGSAIVEAPRYTAVAAVAWTAGRHGVSAVCYLTLENADAADVDESDESVSLSVMHGLVAG